MYKKIFLLVTVMMFLFVTAACSGGTATEPAPVETTEAVAPVETTEAVAPVTGSPAIKVENAWSRPATAMSIAMPTNEGHNEAMPIATDEMTATSEAIPMATDEANSMDMGGNGAVYLTLINGGSEADRILSVTTDVANVAEMHETVMEGNIVKMQPMSDGIEIPAGEQLEFKPGSYHIMLVGLNQDLNEGDSFSVTLEMEKSGSIPVEVEVRQQ